MPSRGPNEGAYAVILIEQEHVLETNANSDTSVTAAKCYMQGSTVQKIQTRERPGEEQPARSQQSHRSKK